MMTNINSETSNKSNKSIKNIENIDSKKNKENENYNDNFKIIFDNIVNKKITFFEGLNLLNKQLKEVKNNKDVNKDMIEEDKALQNKNFYIVIDNFVEVIFIKNLISYFNELVFKNSKSKRPKIKDELSYYSLALILDKLYLSVVNTINYHIFDIIKKLKEEIERNIGRIKGKDDIKAIVKY